MSQNHGSSDAGQRPGATAPSGGSAVHAVTSLGATLGKVAVLMGGASAEREVSFMSGTGVLQALLSKGWMHTHLTQPSATWAI